MNLMIPSSFFLFIYLFTSSVSAQQRYSGNSVLNCNNNDDSGPSPSILYTCNINKSSCQAFVIFKSSPPFVSVTSISTLLSSDPSQIAAINNISIFSNFDVEKEVIVPVNCFCSGKYYQANSSYEIPTSSSTYYTISLKTYQGLSTCDSLKAQNVYEEKALVPGVRLRVPLRCACPTGNQTARGMKYLLTYSISLGDDLTSISERFNLTRKELTEANGFSEDNPTIFPLTTIIIPLPGKPSSSQTITHPAPEIFSSPYIPRGQGRTSKQRPSLGIVISVSSVVLVCTVLAIILVYYRKNMSKQNKKNRVILPEDLLVEIASADLALKVYMYEALKEATNSFDSVSRIKGSVYRGVLGGKIVAIKKMSRDLWKEAKILNTVNHFNLIRLYGVCEYNGYAYTVYEYMDNGCLRNWLYSNNSSAVLSWSQRVQISLDIANGIHYLHNFTQPPYVHKDITSSNVLLDGNLRAKIANFGLATATEISGDRLLSTKFVGTRGYMAPEYLESGLVTSKLDVYAFGVVILELITGKSVVIMRDGKETLLSSAIIAAMEVENMVAELYKFLDLSLGVNFRMDLVLEVAKVGAACLKQDPASRPTMEEVVSILLKIQRDGEML